MDILNANQNMSPWKISIFLGIIVVLCFPPGINSKFPAMNEKTWTYELKSVESKSSNPDLMSFSWRVERIARGIYSMSGSYKMLVDIVEGDNNEVEMLSYRSENGIDDFKILPFQVQRQHMFKFFNTFYKDMAMDTLKDCSDMPAFTDKFQPPFEKKTYMLNKCQFSDDNYPPHLQDGFYKIVINGYGTVEWTLAILIQIEQSY